MSGKMAVNLRLPKLVVIFCLLANQVWAWPAALTQKSNLSPILIKETPAVTIGNPPYRVSIQESLTFKNMIIKTANYRQLKNDWGSVDFAPLVLMVRNDKILSKKVLEFVETIGSEKQNLMAIYGLTNREYNRLAVLAFGALGNESEFFGSLKYQAKEAAPLLITGVKKAKIAQKIVKNELAEKQALYISRMEAMLEPGRSPTERLMIYANILIFGSTTTNDILDALTTGDWHTEANSRGPTQIKEIPELIAKHYGNEGIKTSTLKNPRHAALATMGYMANSLHQMRRHVRNRDIKFISEENIYDYLPYIYFGQVRMIFREQATPAENHYIARLRENIQWLEMFEQVAP